MSRTAMPQFPKVYMKASQILDGDTIIDETMKQHLLYLTKKQLID